MSVPSLQAKEAQEVLASLQSAMKETPVLASERHLLLRQQFTDLQERTRCCSESLYILLMFQDLDVLITRLFALLIHSRDLERLMKSANNLRKAADAFLGATILGVPLLLIVGSKNQA